MSDPFAIVPQSLFKQSGLSVNERWLVSYMLGKYQTTKKDGTPWTFSNASFIMEAGMSKTTVCRITKKLVIRKVLKHYGELTYGENRRPTTLWTLDKTALDSYLLLNSKMRLNVSTNENSPAIEIEAPIGEGLNPIESPKLNPIESPKTTHYKEDDKIQNNQKKIFPSENGSLVNAIGEKEVPSKQKKLPEWYINDSLEQFTAYPKLDSAPKEHCCARTQAIIKGVNYCLSSTDPSGFQLNLVTDDAAKGTEINGHRVYGYDLDQQIALVIGDRLSWVTHPSIQALCSHFEGSHWKVLMYVAECNVVALMVRTRIPLDKQPQSRSNSASE